VASGNNWTLTYDGFVPAEEGLREALCTLGNGYFATRGAAPEARADGVHYPGTYAAGCYDRARSDVAGRVVEDESLVNLPNWLPLSVAVADGDWLDVTQVELLEHRQVLDLREGVLTRWIRWRDPAGRITRLTQRRFVHLEKVHLAGLQTTVVAENWTGPLHVRSSVDGTVTNTGVARYRDLTSEHLDPVHAQLLGEDGMLLAARTRQSQVTIVEAARTRLTHNGVPVTPPITPQLEPARVGVRLHVDVTAGDEIVIDKIVALTTSRDRAISEPISAAVDWLGDAGTFDELLATHQVAWAHVWDRFAFDLEKADHALTVLRLHLFHVLVTVSAGHIDDVDAGVPARGLHGEAYRGHVFWDELFVYPVLNLRMPELTRALLRYRYRRLPAARRAAAEAGYPGAMYPWQSGSDGREETQLVHLNPRSGRWLPDDTRRQRHVGLAVAYSVWQYYQASGDMGFLERYGAEMILEIARFFAHLATYDRGLDRYVIRGVVGPDEFHTAYPGAETGGIDNNAYTNLMTTWVLRRAEDALAALVEPRRTELVEQLGITAAERAHWRDVARRMFVPFHDGLISQFEGYEKLAALDWDAYRARYGDIHRLDRILEAEGDSVNRYQVSKQADVLMLFYLLSADELGELLHGAGYDWDPTSIPPTIDYYLARTSHGSTLSSVVHAWVLARAHREQARDFFYQALASDVADVQGGTTQEGIHLAAMAGSADLLQRCFAGVDAWGDCLHVEPTWPIDLGALEFTLRYRGHTLDLQVTGREVRVSSRAGGPSTPVRVACRTNQQYLEAGATVHLPARGPEQVTSATG
jgi:trehalose 6-phosphate phosphatase